MPLSRFLLRAPLLPAAALGRGPRALLKHPLGRQAIALASPSLAAAAPGAKRDRALARYARRAAFRATPHGLLAGVAMGSLARATSIATGAPTARWTTSWARVDDAARALLDDEAVRARTRLRAAPSLVVTPTSVRWLGPGEPFAEARIAERDDRLAAILAAAERWRPWPEVRAAAGGDGDADELLLLLLDDGLLQSDLAPPLVGPPPADHLRSALAALGHDGPPLDDDQATLVFAGQATLARAAVTRAARLVPLLVRLQEALAPPASERLAQPALADALDAVTDGFGAGAFAAGALAAEGYGVTPADDDEPRPAPPLSPPLLALFVDAIAAAAAARRNEAALDPTALADALGDDAPLPRTAELFLVPVPARRGAPPGTGWLLGLHAPAGASFGRFAHALGPPMTATLAELAERERRAFPEEETVDVAFAPSPLLADLAAHPPTRGRALALTHWTTAESDLDAPGSDAARRPRRSRRARVAGGYGGDRSVAARPAPLGDRAGRRRTATGRLEPAAPARPVGPAAGAVRRAGVRAAAVDRRLRRPPGELATPRAAAGGERRRRARALAAGGTGAAVRPGRRRGRDAPGRPGGAGRGGRPGRARARLRDLAPARRGRRSRRPPAGSRRHGRRRRPPRPPARAPHGRPAARRGRAARRVAHVQAVRRGHAPAGAARRRRRRGARGAGGARARRLVLSPIRRRTGATPPPAPPRPRPGRPGDVRAPAAAGDGTGARGRVVDRDSR